MIHALFNTKKQVLWLSLIALSLVLHYEACSPMKTQSLLTEKSTSSDICTITATSQSVLKSQALQKITPLFEEQKVRLDGAITSKATNSLLNQSLSIEVDLKCASQADSLSAQILSQNPNLKTPLSRYTFSFKITEDISRSEFTTLADNDSCILGVTWPREVQINQSSLPQTNDISLHNQTYLQISDYYHAYEHLVKKANGLKNVKIGLVDTGASCNHEDLKDNLVSNCGFDAINGSSAEDKDGHGSHVAGLIGAVTNNGKGILGIIGNTAELHAIRVINIDTGTSTDTANGIQYAIDNHMDVINISLGASSRMYDVESKIQQAVAAGIFVSMAAGNNGKEIDPNDNEKITSPAVIGKNLNGAMTVGSINADNSGLSYFSNYGSYVEIAAVGALTNNTSSQVAGLISTNKDGMYKKIMGTSQASPMVAGAAALLIQFFKQNGVSYSVGDIENIIKNSVDINTTVSIAGNRILNYAKLTRNAYSFAGIELCPTTTP